MAILELIADKGTYHLTAEAVEAANAWFGSHTRGRGFGNGRLARNLFEAAVSRHATRLVEVEEPTDEQLTTLEAIDIASVPVADTPSETTPGEILDALLAEATDDEASNTASADDEEPEAENGSS